LQAAPDNLLICATSNRRHLLPEFQRENREAKVVDGEIHQGEGVEEKISLSDRFGLWLSFYPSGQDQYLQVVQHWLEHLDATITDPKTVNRAAKRPHAKVKLRDQRRQRSRHPLLHYSNCTLLASL
jgi:predicted AAA+ superfamily ATPase